MPRGIQKLKRSSRKARRARILLQIDADGPDWCDCQVADAFGWRERTVGNLRKGCVLEGFLLTLNWQQQNWSTWPPKRLEGWQEVAVIALLLGPTPAGYGRRSLRLLAPDAVGVCESICQETGNRTLNLAA